MIMLSSNRTGLRSRLPDDCDGIQNGLSRLSVCRRMLKQF